MDLNYTLPVKEIIEWRRHLHQNPELSFQEIKTSQFIYDILSTFPNLKITRPTKTSVVATLKGNKPGKTIALRADIDALPVKEESDVNFKSINDGVMHACGHDTHTAMLLGAAKVLSEMKENISGTVKFIFQHAEELAPGGAKELVDKGIISDVDYIFGIHIAPNIPVGVVGSRKGSLTASSDSFELLIKGNGSHASTPELAIDPILIGAEIVTNLNNIVSRNISPSDNVVISIGQFTGGNAANVIPDSVTIKGSVRTINNKSRMFVKKRIEEVIAGLTNAYGAKYDLNYRLGYSSVFNDEEAFEIAKESATKVVTERGFIIVPQIMGSEDFSAYTDAKKGCFMFLGGGATEDGFCYMNHHPKFKIDERALAIGTQVEVQLILDILCK